MKPTVCHKLSLMSKASQNIKQSVLLFTLLLLIKTSTYMYWDNAQVFDVPGVFQYTVDSNMVRNRICFSEIRISI